MHSRKPSQPSQRMEADVEWYALTVRGGAEAAVAGLEPIGGTPSGLRAYGIECYLPMERRQIRPRVAKAIRLVERPLLPGYVFAALAPRDWAVLDRFSAIVGVVARGDVPIQVRPSDLDRMRRIEAEVAEQKAPQSGRVLLLRGTRVEVVGTAMDGWTGRVANDAGSRAGRVLIDFGLRAVAVPIDAIKRSA